MTTAAPTPAVEATSDMAHTPDPATQAPPAQSAATAARPTLRGQIADNPLLSFLGALIVVLLTAAIASPHMRISDTNDRIDRIEDTMQAGFAALDNKIDTKFGELDNKIDTKFGELDNKISQLDDRIDRIDDRIDRIDVKLAELITALQMTGVVASAAPGRDWDSYRPTRTAS